MPKVPVKSSEIPVGQPLRWNLVDAEGRLILARGAIVAGDPERTALLRRQVYRELEADVLPSLEEVAASIRTDLPTEHRHEVRLLLEETRIQPGDPIQLHVADGLRYAAQLIGYQRNRSIIVSNPLEEGAPIYLRDGLSFIARGYSGRLAFAFPCNVLASASRPYPHVHLSYPVEVVGIRVRKSDRVRVRTITAFDLADGTRGSGIIVDLSTGGAFLLSRAPGLAPGMDIVLKFRLILGGGEYLMELPGEVRSIQANTDTHEFSTGFGIQFRDVSAEDNLVLSMLVSQQLAAASPAET